MLLIDLIRYREDESVELLDGDFDSEPAVFQLDYLLQVGDGLPSNSFLGYLVNRVGIALLSWVLILSVQEEVAGDDFLLLRALLLSHRLGPVFSRSIVELLIVLSFDLSSLKFGLVPHLEVLTLLDGLLVNHLITVEVEQSMHFLSYVLVPLHLADNLLNLGLYLVDLTLKLQSLPGPLPKISRLLPSFQTLEVI